MDTLDDSPPGSERQQNGRVRRNQCSNFILVLMNPCPKDNHFVSASKRYLIMVCVDVVKERMNKSFIFESYESERSMLFLQ
jgi:hypothetical protein